MRDVGSRVGRTWSPVNQSADAASAHLNLCDFSHSVLALKRGKSRRWLLGRHWTACIKFLALG